MSGEQKVKYDYEAEVKRMFANFDVGGLPTLCPQCGPHVNVDEDGCCMACGADALGPGAEAVMRIVHDRARIIVANRDEVAALNGELDISMGQSKHWKEWAENLEKKLDEARARTAEVIDREMALRGINAMYEKELEWLLEILDGHRHGRMPSGGDCGCDICEAYESVKAKLKNISDAATFYILEVQRKAWADGFIEGEAYGESVDGSGCHKAEEPVNPYAALEAAPPKEVSET